MEFDPRNIGRELFGVLRLGTAILSLSVPPAGWWLVGDLSEAGDPRTLHYMLEPPRLNQTLAASIGVVALIASILTLSAIWYVVSTRQADQRWLRLAVLLSVAGLILSVGLRILTAGVHGANIGGGLVIMFGLPLLIVVLVFALRVAMSKTRDCERR